MLDYSPKEREAFLNEGGLLDYMLQKMTKMAGIQGEKATAPELFQTVNSSRQAWLDYKAIVSNILDIVEGKEPSRGAYKPEIEVDSQHREIEDFKALQNRVLKTRENLRSHGTERTPDQRAASARRRISEMLASKEAEESPTDIRKPGRASKRRATRAARKNGRC